MDAYEPLRLFLHLSRTLHFGRTSAECNVSTSTLSRTIQRLERDVGATLFIRDRRRVELTPAGVVLQRHVSDVLERWERARRELAGAERVSGELSIFCTVTASQSILPAALGRFRERYPDVQIRLETGYAADALDMLDDVDVTVAALPEKVPAALVTVTLATTPLVFVAPTGPGDVSRAVERARVDWSEVPMVLPSFGLARGHVDRWFGRRRIRPLVYTEIQGHEAILSLVALGCGVGVVPSLVLEKSPLRSQLRVVDVRPKLPSFRVGAAARRGCITAGPVAALWETLAAFPDA